MPTVIFYPGEARLIRLEASAGFDSMIAKVTLWSQVRVLAITSEMSVVATTNGRLTLELAYPDLTVTAQLYQDGRYGEEKAFIEQGGCEGAPVVPAQTLTAITPPKSGDDPRSPLLCIDRDT